MNAAMTAAISQVTEALPDMSVRDATDALDAAVPATLRGAARFLEGLAEHMAAHPDAFASGEPHGPPALIRLTHVPHSAGQLASRKSPGNWSPRSRAERCSGAVIHSPFGADLDLASARLTVKNPREQRVIYLDDVTLEVLSRWLRYRHERWPASPNPYLFAVRLGVSVSVVTLRRPEMQLRYGMNPQQATARATPVTADSWPVRVVHGQPSLINMLDALNAWQLVREADQLLGRPADSSWCGFPPMGVRE